MRRSRLAKKYVEDEKEDFFSNVILKWKNGWIINCIDWISDLVPRITKITQWKNELRTCYNNTPVFYKNISIFSISQDAVESYTFYIDIYDRSYPPANFQSNRKDSFL